MTCGVRGRDAEGRDREPRETGVRGSPRTRRRQLDSDVPGARALELGQARLDLELAVGVLEARELLLERRGRDFLHPARHRLFAADPLFEPVEVAGRVHDRDVPHGLLDLALRRGHLGAADQLVALADQLLALHAQLVEPVLELVGQLGLLGDLDVEGADLLFEAELAPDRDLGEPVEAVGLGGIALGTELVGAPAGGDSLVAPLARRFACLAGVVLEEAQVADGLGDGLLGLGDVVREVPDELVEHLLGILGAVEHRVHVGAHQLPDAPEDRCLCHFRPPVACVFPWWTWFASRNDAGRLPATAPRTTSAAATAPAEAAAEAATPRLPPELPPPDPPNGPDEPHGVPPQPPPPHELPPRPPDRMPPRMPPRIWPATSAPVVPGEPPPVPPP